MRTKPSQTPKTDSYGARPIGFYSCETVPAEFARKLERQNTELLEELNRVDLEITQTVIASNIGPRKNQSDFLRGQLRRIQVHVAAEIARATGEAQP